MSLTFEEKMKEEDPIVTLSRTLKKDPRLIYLFEEINPEEEKATVKVLRWCLAKVLAHGKALRRNRKRLKDEQIHTLVRCQEMAKNIELLIDYIETEEI